MLSTVSAVQILAMIDAISELDKRGKGKALVAKCKHAHLDLRLLASLLTGCKTDIADLQNRQSGTFAGDEFGEEDTRFLYGAFNSLSLLRQLHVIDIDKAVGYIASCANFDGGYGASPGSESHAGQIFTCLGALSIAGRLNLVNIEKLATWLSERQVEGGGLNGRPEKLEDVCYSWWVLSSLSMIGKIHWIHGKKLKAFILRCQVSNPYLIFERYLTLNRIRRKEESLTDLEIWLMSSIHASALLD